MSEHVLVCVNHPDRETSLRCNRCNDPICVSCAVQTPVGYRCRACIRGQQQVFETTRAADLPIAFTISAGCIAIAAAVLSYLSYWGLFVAPIVGGGVAEIVRWLTRRRRHLRLPLISALGGGVGVLIFLIYLFISELRWHFYGGGLDGSYLGSFAGSIIWPVAHGALMISALYYRMKGIRL